MDKLDPLEDVREDYEHLIHLLSDYETGGIPSTAGDLESLRREIEELEAKLRVPVYMPLLNESVDAWRPVEAFYVAPATYRIDGLVPGDEEWAFAPGTWVRCEEKTFASGETGLTAVSAAA